MGKRIGLVVVITSVLLGIFWTSTIAFSPNAVIRAQGNVTPSPTFPADICGHTLSNITKLLERNFKFNPKAVPGSATYCKDLEAEVNALMDSMLADPLARGFDAEGDNAYAFIDFAARQYVGMMPKGTKFKAVARNGLPDSRMTFVVGDTFAVFVDYTFTTLDKNTFEMLPDYREYSGPIQPRCEAEWCQAPGPRPTASK